MEYLGYLAGFIVLGAVLFYGFRKNSPKKHRDEDDDQWGESLANDEFEDYEPTYKE
ncbi:hypothetical protein HZC00_01070 [Candidatus Kaiserbacteria bacterium]|nr:hypothetical protein [Candidatus Kaiserbacteria bacterium]